MRKSDFIYFALLIILLIGVFYLIHILKSETAQCIKNPYLYGASKMGDVQCDCNQYNNPQCPAKFYFNDTTFMPVRNYCGNPSPSSIIDLGNLSIIK